MKQGRAQCPRHAELIRFSRSLPVGQALRITVSVGGQGVRRRSLVIEADEI